MTGRIGVLVDVDGTLLDTNYLHALAWSRAFRELGTWAPLHAIHRAVGMGADQLVPELLGRDLDGADDAHARHYRELKADMVPFRGAADLLRRLHDAGLVVVLASSASKDDLADMLSVLGAGAAIDETVDADDVDRSKPDPQIFAVARDKAGLAPGLVLAIGDSVWDVRAARAAGMGCVCVESGGTSRAELIAVGARAVYRDVDELGRHLLTSPIAHLVHAACGRRPEAG